MEDQNEQVAADAGAIEAIVAALQAHPQEAEVQAEGCAALTNVCFVNDAAGRAPLAQRVCKNDYTAAGAETSLRESLQRLGLPSVFGLRVHDPNDNNLNKAGMEGFVDEVSQARCRLGLPLERRAEHVEQGQHLPALLRRSGPVQLAGESEVARARDLRTRHRQRAGHAGQGCS